MTEIPPNDEAHGSPQTAGPKDKLTLHLNPISKIVPLQAFGDEFSAFTRLRNQYSLLGLNLYPLDETAFMVTAPALDMYKVLPDLRSAHVYLRQIGGGR